MELSFSIWQIIPVIIGRGPSTIISELNSQLVRRSMSMPIGP